MQAVKRLQLAAVATVTLLISGCSRVTTVSERRDYDYRSSGGKSIEVTESWALPGFLKEFISMLLGEDGAVSAGWAWILVGCLVWFIAVIKSEFF
jgi:hypothetical protein